MAILGGHAAFLTRDDIHLGTNESLRDTAKYGICTAISQIAIADLQFAVYSLVFCQDLWMCCSLEYTDTAI